MNAKNLTLILLLVALFGCLMPYQAKASGFFAGTEVGALVDLDNQETGGSWGAAVGYRWARFFALQAKYSRNFADIDADRFDFTAHVGVPLVIVNPYGIIGAGIYLPDDPGGDIDPLVRVGGGLSFPILKLFSIYTELSYLNVGGGNANFLEPTIGIAFGR